MEWQKGTKRAQVVKGNSWSLSVRSIFLPELIKWNGERAAPDKWLLLPDKSGRRGSSRHVPSTAARQPPCQWIPSYFEVNPGPVLVFPGAAAEEPGEQWCPSHQRDTSKGYRLEKEGGSKRKGEQWRAGLAPWGAGPSAKWRCGASHPKIRKIVPLKVLKCSPLLPWSLSHLVMVGFYLLLNAVLSNEKFKF